MRAMPRALQRLTNFEKPQAVQCFAIEEGGPAHRAGVQQGDLLLGIDGEAIGSIDELHRALPRPGTKVALRMIRPGAGGAMGTPCAGRPLVACNWRCALTPCLTPVSWAHVKR